MNHQTSYDHFEHYIRQAANQFSMKPAPKVWSSIYNNLHPSRKLPSTGSLLIMLLSFLILGGAHTSTKEIKPEHTGHVSNSKFSRNLGMQPISSESVPSIKAGINKKQQKTKSKTNDVIQKANQVMSQVAITPETKKQLKLALYPANKEVESEMLPVFVPITSAQEAKINRHDNPVVEYESIEENQKKIKKHAYQIYATPSIGFRGSIRSAEPAVNTSLSSIDQGSIEPYHHLPDLNLEAGGSFFFKLNKNFRLKAGMQFNYSRYQTQSELSNQTPIANAPAAAENGNPISSSDLNNPAMGQFAEQVNHRSYQISLPIGTEFEVAGNGRLQWIAGATIQPGYQFASHQPTLSSALNKQTPTPSNVGKWNLNTSVETYLSYTLKSGAALIAGPQLRYQLLSMYQKNFIFDERLFNFGMKIGLMRNF